MRKRLNVEATRLTTLAVGMVIAGLANNTQAQQADAPAPSAPSSSAQSGPDVLEEVTVTAQQRSESLQKAALAVDTISAQALVNSGITDVADLTYVVPSLTVSQFNGPYVNYSMRGITNFTTSEVADNSIVVTDNGVPIARPSGAHGVFFDLDRVEVLKGPQGTLYGRNATGGVINAIPRAPGNEFAANVDVDYGNYQEVSIGAGVDLPLSNTVTTRLAVQSVRHEGYYQDGTGDQDDQEARLTVLFKPSDDVSFSIVTDGSHEGGKGPGSSLLNPAASGKGGYLIGPWSGIFNASPVESQAYIAAGATPREPFNAFEDNSFWGITGTLKWNLSFADLTAIAAHREVDLNYAGDVAVQYYGEFGEAHQESLEVRLASNGDGPLKWLGGLFYLRDVGHIAQYSEQSPGLSLSDVGFVNNTYAAFADLTYSLTDALRVTLAGRVNQDAKENYSPRYTLPNYPFQTESFSVQPKPVAADYVGDIDKDYKFNSVTWKAGFEYDVTPTSLAYANVSTGFKAGGFGFGPPGGTQFAPEKVIAYVLGSKNRFLENKLQVNAELYYMKYRDQQISYLAALPSIGDFTVTQNIGSSTLYGLDLDALYLVTSTTRVNLNLQLESTKYDSLEYVSPSNPSGTQTCPVTQVAAGYQVDCGGKPLVNAPRAVVQGGVDQTIPLANGGNLVGAIEARYESARETQLNYLPETHAGAYHKTDLSLTYNEPKERWHVSAYVDNLENAEVPGIVLVGRTYNRATGGLIAASLEAPRTFGVRGGWKF